MTPEDLVAHAARTEVNVVWCYKLYIDGSTSSVLHRSVRRPSKALRDTNMDGARKGHFMPAFHFLHETVGSCLVIMLDGWSPDIRLLPGT
jgi:hypothetical protein